MVWGEENASDVCAAADAASLGIMRRTKPIPLALDEQAIYAFDGDGYRCYELKLPSPQRSIQLFLKGRNVIGAPPRDILARHSMAEPRGADRQRNGPASAAKSADAPL